MAEQGYQALDSGIAATSNIIGGLIYGQQQKEQQKALEKEVKQKQKEMELRRNA